MPHEPGHIRRVLGWHPETFVCSRRGHVTPALLVGRLRPEDAGLGVDLDDGRRMARCTRCDVWIAGTAPEYPVRETLLVAALDAIPEHDAYDTQIGDITVRMYESGGRGTPDLFPDLIAAAIQRRDLGLWAARHDIVAVRPAG